MIQTKQNQTKQKTKFAEFDNPIINTVYKVLSLIALIIVLSANTYYNNDYTQEGETGTAVCRELKAREKRGDLTLHDEVEHLLKGEEHDD